MSGTTSATPTDPASAGAFEGLIVADFSRVLAGPLATMMLGDAGADVIKVESASGDDTRHWGPPFAGPDSTYYLSANRNKRSIVLDIKTDDGRELASRLARRADVVIENFRPDVAERLGIGYDDVCKENPGVVYASLSGFGRDGVGRTLPGYDFLVQALSGLMSITGRADGEPTKVGVAIIDVLAGLNLYSGIATALYHRSRTGRGQRVDVSLMGTALAGMANQSSAWLNGHVVPSRAGNEHPSIAPYESLRSGTVPLVVAVGNDRQFARFAQALGLPDLATDERFATNRARVEHRQAMIEAIEAALITRPAVEWVALLTEAGVSCGAVNTIDGAFELASSLGMVAEHTVLRGDGSSVSQVANPISFSATPVTYRLAPPGLGEHTEELTTWLRDAEHDRATVI